MTSKMIRSGTLAVALVSFGLVAGCATPEQPLESNLASESAPVRSCAQWFANLDDAVDRSGVRDAGPTRIPGFPTLRVDRFLASFAPAATATPAGFAAWVERLRDLDRAARTIELRNMDSATMRSLGVRDSAEAIQRTETCADLLQRHDLGMAEQRRQLVSRVDVPDDYHTINRVLGLYPLTSIPFAHGIETWHEDAAAQFIPASAVSGATAAAATVRFEPAGRPGDVREIAALFARTPADALGIPRFTADDRATLLRTFAPVFDIGTTGPYDRFGPLVWRGGAAPEVDPQRPTAYQRLAFTRVNGRVLAQLVYTVWFPERPSEKWLDMLSGRLDGVVFRVTLDPQGRPLIYDSIHPCGCYHMFFPTGRIALKPAPDGDQEWAFVPTFAPTLVLPQRIIVRTESRTHYIIGIGPGPDDGQPHGTPYTLVEDQDLRTLPAPDGRTRSAFGPDGLVPGTERGERFLFWPMGISSPGTMREWGHHATAFTEQRHFDDPDLIERRFSVPSFL